MTASPSYRCGLCQRVSHNPNDLAERYCSCCGSEDGLLPKDCEHVRARRERTEARLAALKRCRGTAVKIVDELIGLGNGLMDSDEFLEGCTMPEALWFATLRGDLAQMRDLLARSEP